MIDNNQKTHSFVDLAGAISESITPSVVQRSRVISVNLKFSDVLTQDTLYIERLNSNDQILERHPFVLYVISATATEFTCVPPTGTMLIAPGEKIRVTFLNTDARTLSAPQSNITYESI